MKNTVLHVCREYRCRFVVMAFMNCSVDPRTGNNLTSPEFTLASDQMVTFSMGYWSNFGNSPISVYKTSELGRTATLLGSYSFPYDTSDAVNHSICLPAGTYQLVFIASEVENAINAGSAAILYQVHLNLESSCTYTSLTGKATVLSPYIITTGLQVFAVLCKAKECSYFVVFRFHETAA